MYSPHLSIRRCKRERFTCDKSEFHRTKERKEEREEKKNKGRKGQDLLLPLTRARACGGAKGREGREEERERMKYPPPPYACTCLHANAHAQERGDEMNAYGR